MDVKAEQRKKQLFPILVIPDGNIMDVKAEQLAKQPSPNIVTPDGISMDVKADPEKQLSPILFNPVNHFKKEPLLSVISLKIVPRLVTAAASDLYIY